jgi:ABC-type polysaccharide/polyol phosphate transport system ATPase subunit
MTEGTSASPEPSGPKRQARVSGDTGDTGTDLPILEVRDVGKFYALSASVGRRQKLREIMRAIAGRGHPAATKLGKGTFWAVDGISLTLDRGASLGIIGANGAGKSTLMKLMAGIILPDRGEVWRRGNTQAMINLSAGINGEFDALANIKNACALRGVDRRSIDDKIKQILDFAELGEHANAPAHTYSSGMKARLGFAICAHMDPDLIIIDEALAVGDATFRNKCLRRLEELRSAGVAMVLVSHSMTQIRQFCRDAVWIHGGRVRASGASSDVTAEYMSYTEELEQERAARIAEKTGKPVKRAKDADTEDALLSQKTGSYGPIIVDPKLVSNVTFDLLLDGKSSKVLPLNAAPQFTFNFRLEQPVSNLNASLVFFRDGGQMIATLSSLNGDLMSHVREPGLVEARARVKDLALGAGNYTIVLAIHDGASYLYRSIATEFSVQSGAVMTWNLVCNFASEFEIEPPAQPDASIKDLR